MGAICPKRHSPQSLDSFHGAVGGSLLSECVCENRSGILKGHTGHRMARSAERCGLAAGLGLKLLRFRATVLCAWVGWQVSFVTTLAMAQLVSRHKANYLLGALYLAAFAPALVMAAFIALVEINSST